MHNPWLALPTTAPYVLPTEREAIDRFNRTYPDPQTQIRLNVLPEPYIGNLDAKVVVLSLNPGFDESDATWHAQPDFAASIHANLRHTPQAYPFYPLNPAFSQSGVYQWWRRRLNDLIQDTSLSAVAKNLLCIEWFPYHSYHYKALPKSISGGLLISQKYAITLVESAIVRGATIIAMRRYRDWVEHVPDLNNYAKVHHLKSTQNGYLSSGNIHNYDGLVRVLDS